MSTDVHGPIDFVLIEFPNDRLSAGVADRIVELLDSGVIRLYDMLVIRKAADGTVSLVEIEAIGDDELGGFSILSGARSGLIDDGDVAEAASTMEPGTMAVLFVYENTWAIPFIAAAHDAGGEVIASARIPAAEVMAALDALEAAV